jgi:hypothetical protein
MTRMVLRNWRFALLLVGIALISTPQYASADTEAILQKKTCNVDGSYNCGGACSDFPAGSPCSWCCQSCNEE